MGSWIPSIFIKPGQRMIHKARLFYALPPPQKAKVVGILAAKSVNFAFAVHLFSEYIGKPSLMNGPSMLPTLANSGELVIEDCLSYRLGRNYARGDLVVFRAPYMPSRIVCKRLIGLPGDVVCVDPTGEKSPSSEHVIIPEGHVWVSGDNASASRDSRDYGPVPIKLIRSRLVARVWPLEQRRLFRDPITYLDYGSQSD